MTFEEARPIIESWLYEYGLYRREPPAPPVSAVYDQAAAPPPKPLPPRSQVESYVVRHEREIRVEGALGRLGPMERRAVELRYCDRARVTQVASALDVSRSTAHRLLERGLYAMAALMGLLGEDVTAEDAARM